MGHIPDDEITRLKSEALVQHLAEARGVRLQRHGQDLIGLCPFHDDHEPSLVITPSKNLWHCLGKCQAGGNVIDWVMKSDRLSFRHAVELLRGDYPANGNGRDAASTTLLSEYVDDASLLGEVVNFYHRALIDSPEALAYLERRGLRSAEMIQRFKLGYANRTLAYRLPPKRHKAGAALRGRLQALGILRESGHEHFNGSLVIPVFDEDGRVTEMYGRKIVRSLRKGTPLHLYLPGAHHGVWNIEAFKASKEIILCEALIDALTLWCCGYRHVTSSYGIEGFTDDHLAAFKEYGTEKVVIAYDGDAPGNQAAAALAEKLISEGLDCYRINLPEGMDVNEYARKVQPAARSLGVALRSAEWLGKGQPPTAPQNTATKEENDVAPELLPSSVAEPGAASSPSAPVVDIPADIQDDQVVICLGDRRYRIRGLARNLSFDQMRVNILVSQKSGSYVDALELYAARQRSAFTKQAAEELGIKEEIIKKDLGQVLLKLEALQDRRISEALTPKDQTVQLDDEDKAVALDLLQDPRLLERILGDFDRCGVVGEQTNKLMGYLAAVSRKLDEPLAVIILSTSAAGKTSLMDAILSFMPPEDRVKYSAMTGQSLFYMGECDLKHKILALVEEEGAQRAGYAIKLLQSEGELTIASTGKDPASGRLVTQEYRVEGPVQLFLTTTAVDLDEELLNRCILLTVDENREQTQAIHRLQRQRQTLEGLLVTQDSRQVRQVHQNAQRLLRPLLVANPYANELTFADDRTRTRRDHMKYLTLIRSIVLLHQYQRPIKTVQHNGQSLEYIEVTLDDIAVANKLAHEVLGRSLDELPPQSRRLLMLIDEMVTQSCRQQQIERCDYRFSRRDVREHTGWGNTQLRLHLRRLEELEYLLVHRGGRGQSFVYELLYDGPPEDGQRFVMGLIDVQRLSRQYDTEKSGSEGQKSGSNRPQVAPKSGGCRADETDATISSNDSCIPTALDDPENAYPGADEELSSYRTAVQGNA